MSRRSKQSSVVPISIADELDDLLSGEAIKPNIAFLGLSIGDSPALDQPVPARAPEVAPTSEVGWRNLQTSFAQEPPQPKLETSAPGAVNADPTTVASDAVIAPFTSKASGAVIPISAPDADIDPVLSIPYSGVSRNVVISSNNGHSTHPLRDPLRPSSEGLEYRSAPDADINPDEGLGFLEDMPEATQLPGMERRAGRPVKIHKCVKAQDGHSHVENELYGVLRRAGRAEDANSGNVIAQVGSAFLCKETRVHKRNIGALLRRLVFKKSIEVIGHEVSSTRTARRYRVFSYTEILKRRREAGLEWVVRRRGVEFVDPATGSALYRDSDSLDNPETTEPQRITASGAGIAMVNGASRPGASPT